MSSKMSVRDGDQPSSRRVFALDIRLFKLRLIAPAHPNGVLS